MKKQFIFLILFNLFCEAWNLNAQQTKITFEHIGIKQGLPSQVVPCAFQDRTGFIWFGTFKGIARYDGYSIVSYTNITDDTTSISNAIVQAICDDSEGNIWIGNTHGLDKYNPSTGEFKHFIINPKMPLTDWSNHVLSLLEDSDKNLWVGTGGGLYYFDKQNETFKWIVHDSTNPGSIIQNNINSIFETKDGTLWFGTGGGLDKYDRSTKKFIHIWNVNRNTSNNRDVYWILSIMESRDGTIWLGTGGGIVEFNTHEQKFTIYQNEPNNFNSLANNTVLSICEDQFGLLWISTKAGVNVFNRKTKSFTLYAFNQNDMNSLSSNDVGQILRDKSGAIWITTYAGGGVNKFTPSDPSIKRYDLRTNSSGTSESVTISDIVEDSNGIIWIGTLTGLYQFDLKTGLCKKESIDDEVVSLLVDQSGTIWVNLNSGELFYKKKQEIKFNKFLDSAGNAFNEGIITMKNGRNGLIWIGNWDGKIIKLNPTSGELTQLAKHYNWIESIYQDNEGLLWVGTRDQGLYCYDILHNTTKKYSYDRNELSISSNEIERIREDDLGNIWVLAGGSLNKFDKKNKKFIRLGKKDGFPENIYNFIIDFRGNFWISTINGNAKYNPLTRDFINYSEVTGYGHRLKSGKLCFVRFGDFIIFDPDSIQKNNYIPPIVITSFKKFEHPFPFSNQIVLDHTQNFLAFEFAALSFIHPEKNQYAYKMEGVDKDWVYSGTRRYTSYPNLAPGKYTFRAKGSNSDGLWNEKGTSLLIIISPPWWKTWWAYSSYALLFVFALYGIRKYELNRVRLKNKIRMDEAILKEKEETDKIKSRFFANISHELRTPLTLILGPAEKILADDSDDIKKDVTIIRRNSRRLLQLINQLLDLSKLEAGKLKLEVSKGNIVSFVKGAALSFESLAESKDISLKINSEKEFIEMYFDKEKMMKILTNILSNAFKFTPEEGTITVALTIAPSPKGRRMSDISAGTIVKTEGQSESILEIKIKDTGIGIAQEEIPKLFDRFYQVDSSHTREYEGTGIGLALTKELVELHHGSIRVESLKNEWTDFILEFPLGKNHFKDEEIVADETRTAVILNPDKAGMKNQSTEIIDKNHKKDSSSHFDPPHRQAGKLSVTAVKQDKEFGVSDKTIILVVEDNYDMRQYIRESLDGNYFIEEAVNGEQGVRKAEKIIPDLIISDMMMPRMDGNQLVKILKNDEKTSHIPIILLTAKAGQENKLEGLETGADDYLTKPFDIKELQVRIKNLINIRKRLQEKFSKADSVSKPNLKKLPSIDEQFMSKVIKVIEEHLSEESFDIESFGEEVGMSRTQFYRKLKAITGMPASIYLRTVRLSKAKQMIESRQGTISEISFSVGFSSPSYFSKCFKDEFGYPPSEADNPV